MYFRNVAEPRIKRQGIKSDSYGRFLFTIPENSFLGVSLLAPIPNERRFALTNIGHVWNMRVGDRYCYSVGYSCFKNVFPRCAEDVKPSFAGHTCFETRSDLMDLSDPISVRDLDAVEREQVLGRARRILEVNRTMVVDGLFR